MNYDHGGNVFGTARCMGIDSGRLLDFSASINPLGMPDGVRTAIHGAVGALLHYPDPYAEPLREAVARYHAVAPENILPANGSTELIYLLPRLLNPGRGLIITPAFSEYAKSLAIAGWDIDSIPLLPGDNFQLNPDKLRERLVGCSMLFMCNPGNPTGWLYSRDELLQVIALCRDAGTLLVLDEAFIDFCGEEKSLLREVVASGSGVVLRSLTKFYAIPGLRLGYAAASAEICLKLAELRGPWSVNTLAQAAGVAALRDVTYQSRTRAFIEKERSWLFGQLSTIPGVAPIDGAANYLLAEINGRIPADELCLRLLTRFEILVRNCSSFAGLKSGYIRVAVRSRDENRRLVTALQRLLPEFT